MFLSRSSVSPDAPDKMTFTYWTLLHLQRPLSHHLQNNQWQKSQRRKQKCYTRASIVCDSTTTSAWRTLGLPEMAREGGIEGREAREAREYPAAKSTGARQECIHVYLTPQDN